MLRPQKKKNTVGAAVFSRALMKTLAPKSYGITNSNTIIKKKKEEDDISLLSTSEVMTQTDHTKKEVKN